MAVEHLRELDSLAGFERQEQEEVIKIVTGSMYHGEALHPWTKYIALTSSPPAGSETVRVS
jgi:hypothetical protein